MKNRHIFLSCLLIGIAIFSCIWVPTFFLNRDNQKKPKIKDIPYFMPVPITSFSSSQVPCVTVEIGDKILTAMLDLGFEGRAHILTDVLNEIEGRSLIGSTIKYDFRGQAYPRDIYEIPKMKIVGMTISDLYIEEETGEMHKDGIISGGGDEPSPPEPITLGWELFKKVNLFMDLKNSKIAVCDSFITLIEEGYSADKFVKVPLIIEGGFVEVEAITPNGPLLCMLDTGATLNFINIENEEGRTSEEIFCDPASNTQFASFQLGKRDFGSTQFHHLPIRLPSHVDAILGMEFLRDHLVFIDFEKKEIYFAESTQEPESIENPSSELVAAS